MLIDIYKFTSCKIPNYVQFTTLIQELQIYISQIYKLQNDNLRTNIFDPNGFP